MVLPDSQELADAPAVPSDALRALVDVLRNADFRAPRDALEAFAAVTVEICGADAAVVRLADANGADLTAHAVHASSASLAAELEGSRLARGEEPSFARLAYGFSVPIEFGGDLLGSLDVLRDGSAFADNERLLAQLAAGALALALRALGPAEEGAESAVERALVLAGEGLAAGAQTDDAADHVARLAADAAGAGAVALWRSEGGEPIAASTFGDSPVAAAAALSAARIALASHSFLVQERIGGAALVS